MQDLEKCFTHKHKCYYTEMKLWQKLMIGYVQSQYIYFFHEELSLLPTVP